jgi:shikimate kinase
VNVEIVGLVGSGKTSVAAELRRQRPGVQHGLSLLRARYLPLITRSMLRTLVTARWYRPARLERPSYVLKLLWHLDAQLAVLAEVPPPADRTLIFEEGPIFKLCWITVSAREAGVRSDVFDRWFESMRRKCAAAIHTVAWLDAPHEVLLQRVRARPRLTGYGVKYKPDAEAYRLLDTYATTYRDIVNDLVDNEQVRVLRFNTVEQSPASIAQALHEVCEHRETSGAAGDAAR